jgi:hypothetical protein
VILSERRVGLGLAGWTGAPLTLPTPAPAARATLQV